MSKFMCKCGDVIRDQSDSLPYKGYLFADTEFFGLWERISADIAAYVNARTAGSERQWISQYFDSRYPCTKDEDVVHDIISRYLLPAHIDVYQCPKCGRVHVEHRDDRQKLSGFSPDDQPHKDVFHV